MSNSRVRRKILDPKVQPLEQAMDTERIRCLE